MRLALSVLLAATLVLDGGPGWAQGRRQQPQPQGEEQQDVQRDRGKKRRQGQTQGQGQNQRQNQGHPIRALVDQANAAFQAGQYAEAEKLYRQVLDMREQKLGDESFPVVQVLNRLGYSLVELGRFAEGEQLFRRALATAEQISGGEQPSVALSLNNLGYALRRQGRSTEAEAVIRRSLAMREKLLGPDHPDVANSLYSLAQAIGVIVRPAEAEPLLRRALAIREAAYGRDHPLVARTHNAIADVLRVQGKGEEAEALMRQALAVQEAKLGPEHPRIALALNALGMAQLSLKRYAQAEASFRRSVAIREAAFGVNHPDTAQSYGNLAFALGHQQRAEEALAAIRKATSIHVARRAGEDQRSDEAAEGERRTARWLFTRHVGIAYLNGQRSPEKRPEMSREAFEMQQWAQTGGVGGALARMAARFAAGDGPLAALVRERQDVQARRQVLDRALIDAASKPTAERSREQEVGMRAQIATLDKQLDALDARLQNEFPRYEELASIRPLPLGRVRDLLATDEAMLVYLVREDDAFLWIVRKDRVIWRRLASDRKSLDQAVKGLRAWLDPAQNRAMAPMPLAAAHELYREIMPSADEALRGVKHLLVVPDGPLQSLPFAVLATEPPEGATTSLGQYATAPWLVRKYALTLLPSVSALKSLRVVAKDVKEREPFVGYGDPELAGAAAGKRTAPPPRVERGIADVTAVRAMEPLPESAIELRDMAKGFRAAPGAVHLRRAATEAAIKSADLARYRVIAFATHGLMAGEFGENSEPALVLTPPAVGTAEDDGLLMASEVAQLKLDADWVILSACNTAAPDGTPGAEGLSGLAKAFISAGARSLLVSHWAVASDAAVRLTTGAVAAMDGEPKIGRAEALRRSMLALLEDKAMAHPMFWAPFVLVGEGGTGR
jgi:CHAT domain-containing protein/tetratricopeptide (TPR) repeat protein